jgi:hypothetical protein
MASTNKSLAEMSKSMEFREPRAFVQKCTAILHKSHASHVIAAVVRRERGIEATAEPMASMNKSLAEMNKSLD